MSSHIRYDWAAALRPRREADVPIADDDQHEPTFDVPSPRDALVMSEDKER